MSVDKKIRVMVVEDDPAHAEMIRHHLVESGCFSMNIVTTLEDCRSAILLSPPDILLIDLNLPDGDAIELLSNTKMKFPVLVMTSQGSEEKAVETLKAGAQDYLVKSADTFRQMPRIVEQSLREWWINQEREKAIEALNKSLHELEVSRVELEMQNIELRQSRDEAEMFLAKYSDLYEFAPVGYLTLDRQGTINSVNLRGASLLNVARPRLLGQRFGLLIADENRQIFADFLEHSFINQDKTSCEVALKNKENRPFFVQLEAMATISGEECGLALLDITERKLAAADMRNYTSRLITMEEELRVNLAAELHDEICRDLTVLGLNLAIIYDTMIDVAPKKLISRVKDSGKIIKGISHTVRNIMVGLRPPMLDDFGLLAAVRWHADLFSKRTGVEVSIQADEPFPRFTVEKETALFRISQEALMNVSKHAKTQNVTIKLRKTNDMIMFEVIDEGRGFLVKKSSFNQTGCGWGMTIMRERAELNGGRFRVDSAPGKGTTVSVIMPLGAI